MPPTYIGLLHMGSAMLAWSLAIYFVVCMPPQYPCATKTERADQLSQDRMPQLQGCAVTCWDATVQHVRADIEMGRHCHPAYVRHRSTMLVSYSLCDRAHHDWHIMQRAMVESPRRNDVARCDKVISMLQRAHPGRRTMRIDKTTPRACGT